MTQFPNFISFTRILLSPVILMFILNYMYTSAVLLYVFASLTDLFDGLVARRLNVSSDFGAWLDEFADKVLVVTSLVAITLVVSEISNFKIFTYINLGLIVRHVLMVVIRKWCSYKKISHLVKVIWVAKFKTLIEMIYVGYFIFVLNLTQGDVAVSDQVNFVINCILYVFGASSLLLSYFSLSIYVKNVLEHLTILSRKG